MFWEISDEMSIMSSSSTVIGIIADIHGDLPSFQRALAVLEREHVSRIVCAGDIADRGPDADAIVRHLKARDIICIRGNHDLTVSEYQEYWRSRDDAESLAERGRIVNDETLGFLKDLPEIAQFTIAGVPILMAHGAPWDDMLRIFPHSDRRIYDSIVHNYGYDADVIILGHTHMPMHVRVSGMWVLNPGSVYGESVRDSHTCATLTLPDCVFQVFDLESGQPLEIPVVWR